MYYFISQIMVSFPGSLIFPPFQSEIRAREEGGKMTDPGNEVGPILDVPG